MRVNILRTIRAEVNASAHLTKRRRFLLIPFLYEYHVYVRGIGYYTTTSRSVALEMLEFMKRRKIELTIQDMRDMIKLRS